MNRNFMASLRKPPVYTKSKAAFWNDEYISKQMLMAHLDPDSDGASRKWDFIEKSAAWIAERIPPADYPLLLDIGCGPGIYAERFVQKGDYLWNTYFSKETFMQEAENAGFKMCGLFSDAAGRIYRPESDTIAFILEKWQFLLTFK